ncbi:MAG: cation acetate symporter [Spirochaetota bacterium]
MIYTPSVMAVLLFSLFVVSVLVISLYFAKRTKSSKAFFAAGGQINWAVNGIAFAGDYLSAASFLGICGLIAFFGYDGFLYSIGFLAGWVVALFVVAEPIKRMGKYTFADALDSSFNSKEIQLTAAVSTLVVSFCYLIPQMVGAGALVTPLLGIQHYWGVIIVGTIVIVIVATAGMASTTYVQFLKGGLLIVFSTIVVILVLVNGLNKPPGKEYHTFETITSSQLRDGDFKILSEADIDGKKMVKIQKDGYPAWWYKKGSSDYLEALSMTVLPFGEKLYNGAPNTDERFYPVGHMSSIIVDGKDVERTGPIGPFKFLSVIHNSEVVRFTRVTFLDGDNRVTVWHQDPTPGREILRPGLKFKVDKGSTFWSKMNFVSLMLALFLGTSALPHVLIRYYTVPSPKDARKSTIVAIAAIGFFYILTLYMGLGAMVNGVLDLESSNMSAPLLAKYFGIFLFAIISAIAFATVLGTVSGLIVAASGAVAHDLIKNFFNIALDDDGQVKAGKISAAVVGVLAIILGILLKGMNVSFLVGLAFAVAASSNLPSIVMLLFWKKTTKHGIAASILVGVISSLTLILLSPSMWERYGFVTIAPVPIDNPGIITIPLSFLTLVVVSLCTQKSKGQVMENNTA